MSAFIYNAVTRVRPKTYWQSQSVHVGVPLVLVGMITGYNGEFTCNGVGVLFFFKVIPRVCCHSLALLRAHCQVGDSGIVVLLI